MTDLSAQIVEKLKSLQTSVARDLAALQSADSPRINADALSAGQKVYQELIDAMDANLHNLQDRS